MKIKNLQIKRAARAVLIGLLLGVAGVMKGYAAWDFSAVCSTGQALYYRIIDSGKKYVEVTYPGTIMFGAGYYSGYIEPSGNITLPKTVKNGSTTYTVTKIGDYAFCSCSGLTGSLTIPNSVTTIGIAAFSGCSGFTGSLTIPNSVTSIDRGAFGSCNGLSGNLTIPNSVTTIGANAFKGCTGFSGSLTIPNSVTSIGRAAFENCSGFTGNLTISNSVTSIGDFAFNGCSGFKGSLTISTSLTAIGMYVFQDCSGFTGSLTIPNSVTSIGKDAFQNCTGFDGSLTIGNSVTTIGESAFGGCNGLKGNLTIGTSVTTIGGGAFSNCSGLTGSLTIPNSVTSIGGSAFNNCSGFTGSLIIPNSVTTIGEYAFRSCIGFNGSLTIPNSVTSIGNSAFNNCGGFETIEVETGNSFYDSRSNCNALINTTTNELVLGCKNTVVPNSVASIGNHAFYSCSGLTGLIIPNSVTTIDNWAFSNCSGLTGLIIPNSVTTIGGWAFYQCSGLTGSLIIPNSVTSIGESAFLECTNLTEVMVYGTTPPSIGYNILSYGLGLPIYVPYESLNAYKTADRWSTYESRIYPWLQKSVSGYGDSGESDKWAFIASPLMENTAPTAIDNMLAETAAEYDLYRFNQSAVMNNEGLTLEWENYKEHEGNAAPGFSLENGRGYLYANKENVDLIFKGTFNENNSQAIDLIYDAGKDLAGWNLVGNPFPYPATVSRSYYVMNEYGTGIAPTALSAGTSIEACTGIVVKAESTETNPTVTFNKVSQQATSNNGLLQIAVVNADTRSNAVEDKAIVSFNEGDRLSKFYFGRQNANIYIPQNGKEYAIATSNGQGEMPVNFKVHENGTYTLSINPEGVEMNYLHLIDNMTGADTDLLNNPSYSFEAKTTDYESRFRLVFAANGIEENESENESFAFFSNGSLIVSNSGQATLQVIDMIGRILSSEIIDGSVSKAINVVSGVYMIRLINGNDVKTQKIVVR